MAKRPRSNRVEHKMAKALDDLAEFEKFQEDILPVLRKAVAESWSAEKLFAHPRTQALLAAKAVTIGLTDRDSSRSLAAIKDVLDRSQGKAIERREVKHQLEKLPDDQLDALLETAWAESSQDDETLN